MLHPDHTRRATLETILLDPWYLNENVATPEEVRALFDSRRLSMTQLPAVRVTQALPDQ